MKKAHTEWCGKLRRILAIETKRNVRRGNSFMRKYSVGHRCPCLLKQVFIALPKMFDYPSDDWEYVN